jgi:tetratricopeptide (TPR) repeat protein
MRPSHLRLRNRRFIALSAKAVRNSPQSRFLIYLKAAMREIAPTILSVLVMLGASAAPSAQAQNVQDPQLSALLDARSFVEAQKAATAKLATKPDDMDLLTALGLAASGGVDTDTKRREDALKTLEACTERLPKAAPCHWATGAVAGTIAMQGGMMKGMAMAPKIKSAFVKALEADALYAPARSGLVQYYLMAPAVAGGSVAKALEVATAEQTRQPENAKLFKATVFMHEKKWAQAEAALASLAPLPATDKAFRESAEQTWLTLGFNYLSEKEPSKAKAIMQRAATERPDVAWGSYGLGRALTDLGEHDAAIAALQKSATLKDADKLPVDYRLGLALLAKGDKAAAKAALTKAVASKSSSERTRKEAQKKLDELG